MPPVGFESAISAGGRPQNYALERTANGIGCHPVYSPKIQRLRYIKLLILPVVLYGCETRSLKLGEERRLRVFENRLLRRIFGPKRDEVTWDWRKLHNEELNGLYCSPSIVRVIKSRRMRRMEHVARMGERRGVYRVFWWGN